MSLDVYLIRDDSDLLVAADFLEEHGFISAADKIRKLPGEKLYESGITHNLTKMASEAVVYHACWRPEEIGISRADQLVPLLREGLERLQADPARYKKFNPDNGYGSYDGLIKFVANYLEACEKYPEAIIKVDR